MECNKEEALRAKELAEEKMGVGDFVGAQKLVMKVKQLFPDLENLQHLVAICDVHCSAQNKISGLENWYGILQVKHFADEATIRKQYRKLALLLHPDKNRFVGAEAAFKLVGEANRLLTDRTKRSQYDIKYRIFSRSSSLKPGTKQSNMNSSRQYAPANTAADSTGNQKPMDFAFWTCCEHCGFRYKYLREYVNTVMHCSSCQRPYVAVDTGRNGVSPRSTPSQFCERKEVPSHGPCNVPLQNNSAGPTGGRSGNAATEMGTNMMRKEKLNKNEVKNQNNDTEVWKPQKDKGGANNDAKNSKSEKNKGGIMNDAEVPKADAVKPQFEVTESESGATKPAPDVTDPKGDETATAKSKHKKKRRKVVEESNDSFEIDGCDNVGSEKAVNGNNKRRSSRNKRKASYSDNGSDDDFVSPPKASKSHGEFKSDDDMKEADLVGGLPGGANSDGSPAIAETHKEKTDKEADSVSEDILSNKDKRSEDCEANGEEAFPSTKVDKIDKVSKANKENPKLEECPDPDFSQFDRTISDFAVNQVWAIYDPLDGMPRFYARIRKVLTAQLKLQMTWLESLPVIQDPENEIDIPIACGKFESREMEETEDLLMFSHQMHCSKRGKNSIIYPKKGETWALFRDWDISWTTDPDKHKPPYRYDFVEVLSDFKEKAGDGGVSGIGVYYLKKVKGFVSLFVRATQEEVLACYFPPGEMNRFSHKVPSFKMTGKEREGVPPGSFELDPAALPKSIFEVDPCKVNAEMDRQSLDGQADGTCPKAPEVEVKSVAGPESVCSPKKREKIERESGSFSKVSNGISNDQTKIHTNLSSAVEVEGLTRGQDSSASCQVDEMNKVKKSEKSDQIVDTSRVRRSTRVLSEKNNQTSSSQRKAEQKSANDVELSAQSGQYGPSGNKMKTRKKPEKYVLMDSLRIRRSPRSLNKKIDGQLQGNPEKHENSDEPLPHSQKNGSLTESKGSISETRVSSSCRTGKENAYNFTEEKSEDKFRVDQIWALYSADKGMPTEYGLIKKIETTPRFRLFVAPLEPYPLPKISTRPVCCWLFKSKTQKGKLLERSSFSHQVSARRFNRNNYEVSPRKGEIWALYKNSNNTSCTDTNELDIVEVLENNGQIIKAMALTSNGSKTLYVAQRSQGSKTVVIEIPKADMGRFSHQIPAFRHETAKDELDCGSWELDPAAVPGLTIVLD